MAAGNSQCQFNDSAARVSLRASAQGTSTPGTPGSAIPRPQTSGEIDLGAQRRLGRCRQHHRAILAALAVPHVDQAPVEVHILDPERQALLKAQTRRHRATNRSARTPVRTQASSAATSSRDRTTGTCCDVLGPADLAHPGEIDPENLPIEKENGRQRLLVGGGRNLRDRGKVREVAFDLGPAHGLRMLQTVKADEAADPEQIGLLGAQAVVLVANALTHLIKQAQRRPGEGAGAVNPELVDHHRGYICTWATDR